MIKRILIDLPTGLILAASAAAGVAMCLEAADREAAQAEALRQAQVITEPSCWQFCVDCPVRCEQPPIIREADGGTIIATARTK